MNQLNWRRTKKHNLNLNCDPISREYSEILFYTGKEANNQGIRIYCVGSESVETYLKNNELGTIAEQFTSIIYNYDGFKTLHYHKKSSSEQGFDLIVKHEETGVIGIIEVKAHKSKGRLRTYLPIVKSLGEREMSIPWIIHNCKILEKENPKLADEIVANINSLTLERFVIVYMLEDRQIRFFINENFYDDKIDDYLIHGQYRSDSKERVRIINVDLDPVCKAAQVMWETGIPMNVKNEFNELRKVINEITEEK